MSGLGTAANIIRQNIETDEETDDDIGEAIGEALQEGIETAKGEVKAVVAGALKTAVENKVTDILPVDTPVEAITDIACVAVESASALADAAAGRSTITEALDKTGRASVAAACRIGANALKLALKVKLSCIPVVGPLVVILAGGLVNKMKSSKFTEKAYTAVKDTAVAAWEGIKETGRTIGRFWNKVKNIGKKLFE
jgi:hypothetical protein